MKVNINNNEIELKQSFRSHIIYEQITGETFQPKGITEIVTFFYCVVMASAQNLEVDFEQFIDWMDGNPNVLAEFSEWMVATNRRQQGMTAKNDKPQEGKPTAKKKK